MKKLIPLAIVFSLFYSLSKGEHLVPRNASNMTLGTLPNARLDSSSVTMRGPNPISIYSGGTLLGSISEINCTGPAINCTQSGSTGTLNFTGACTPSGTIIGSTFTLVVGFGGEVYFATNSAIPIPGAWLNIGRTTFNITAVQGFTNIPSTVAATGLRIAVSTATGGNTPFSYMSPNIVVSTGNHYANWISTSFSILADSFISIHVTTSPITGNGTMPAEAGIKMEGWWGAP